MGPIVQGTNSSSPRQAPGFDTFQSDADDLTVLQHRLAFGDVALRDLVPQSDGFDNNDSADGNCESVTFGERLNRHTKIVVLVKQQNSGFGEHERLDKTLDWANSSYNKKVVVNLSSRTTIFIVTSFL
jgi:hypothetical protein